MKKFTYLAAFAIGAMTLASCSNDEVLSSVEKSGAIGFSAMANKSGRSGEVTTDNIARFRVYGWTTNLDATTNFATIFDGTDPVLKKTEGWTYTNTQYWAPSRDYYFVAISSNNMEKKWEFTPPTEMTQSYDETTFKGLGTLTTDIADVKADRDIVYAYAFRETDANLTNTTVVPFSFYHMLSRIGVTFKNAIGSTGYKMLISNVKIKGFNKKGSVELGAEPSALAWIVDAADGTITVDFPVSADAPIEKGGTSESEYRFVIPGEQTLTIEFNVEVRVGNSTYSTRTLKGTIAAKEYKPGISYMFTAEINQKNIVEGGAKPIEFTVDSVNGWGNDEPGTIVLPETTTPGTN